MFKNEKIKLEITSLTGGGDGIAHAPDGRVVFVPNTAVGDIIIANIIKVKPKYALAIISEILSPAPDRIESDCPQSSKCGGCVFRHISYEKECDIKYSQVESSINRIGSIPLKPEPIVGGYSRNAYRNKAQYPIGLDRFGKIICGFYAKGSHRIVEAAACALQPKEFSIITDAFLEYANRNKLSVFSEKSGKGLLRHLYLRLAEVSGEIMVTVVINGSSLPKASELISALKEKLGDSFKSLQININKNKTNVVLSNDCRVLYGENSIHDVLRGIKIRLSPLSFYQVNRRMAERLYSIAEELSECDGKYLLDLYCGAGTIGLSMAKRAKKVIGVEIVPEAVEDACHNAEINGIHNAEFICADATSAAKELKRRGEQPDIVLLDPPRKGCDGELIKIVANDFSPERVVYVSCNDATLARDCAQFQNEGYKLERVIPVDMFPATGHVECAALLVRHSDIKS